MEEEINIAELLKGCPKGMELYSPIFGIVYFQEVRNTGRAELIVVTTSCNSTYEFYNDGKFNTHYSDSEMLLFPSKDQRDWSKFQRPFKDGDIVTFNDEESLLVACIYKDRINTTSFYHHIALYKEYLGIIVNKEISLPDNQLRYATEEEKKRLFQAIKDNGYKWNAETKTLERLIKPKFKDWDERVRKGIKAALKFEFNDECRIATDTDVTREEALEWLEEQGKPNPYSGVFFKYNGHIWGMCARDNGVEILIDGEIKERVFLDNKLQGKSAIETMQEEKVDNTNKIEPKFKVGNKIEKCGYRFTIAEVKDDYYLTKCGNKIPIDNQDDFSLVPNKFDITTLKAFESKVLIRDTDAETWRGAFYSHYRSKKFYIINGSYYYQCIPYEGNEHLLNTTKDCDEYYKNWI